MISQHLSPVGYALQPYISWFICSHAVVRGASSSNIHTPFNVPGTCARFPGRQAKRDNRLIAVIVEVQGNCRVFGHRHKHGHGQQSVGWSLVAHLVSIHLTRRIISLVLAV
jgi:hypothetical protein